MYNIQKLPMGETPKTRANNKKDNGCGGTVAVLKTNQKANPATKRPTIDDAKIFTFIYSAARSMRWRTSVDFTCALQFQFDVTPVLPANRRAPG